MKATFIYLFLLSSSLLLTKCGQKNDSTDKQTENLSVESKIDLQVKSTACNIKLGDVVFTRAINGADSLVSVEADGKVKFKCGEKQDFFRDPNGELSSNTAPILLTKIDNEKPFTLIAKVTPGFTTTGLYNAADLFVFASDTLWQKFAFEQDERGKHRIVTVRTQGTSDDTNHDVLTVPSVYLKISSDARTIASYYSLDKKEWQMVRLYRNYYPKELWVGICNQCPQDKGSISFFEDITLEQESVTDFRSGN